MRLPLALIPAVFALACAAPQSGRFRDQQVVWKVSDDRSIAEPKEREFFHQSSLADALIFRPIFTALRPREHGPARDINAIDEVPDSSWFTNRIGVRDLELSEAVIGASASGPPVPPITAIHAKTQGVNPGFLAADSRGIRYLIKFDTLENPRQQTATNVIVNRIFWALGYSVPGDYISWIKFSDLTIGAKAKREGITKAGLAAMLNKVPREPDGSYRITASEFLQGVPKGGFAPTGRRNDDPNDTIDHEHRRVVRALAVFSAWLSHTDLKEDNTVDMYVTVGGRSFLRHHLVDFGEAFGGHQSEKDIKSIGFEYAWDYANQAKALFAFGLWVRPWERQRKTPWPSVGYFGAKHFEPDAWKPRYNYAAFEFADAADRFWAAKLIMRFDRKLLEALVAEGKLSAPATTYLVDTLLQRRDKIGRAYLDGVTPLDRWRVQGQALCAVDLGTLYFGRGGVIERQGAKPVAIVPRQGGWVCLPKAESTGYAVWRVRIRRPSGQTTPWMQVHVRTDGRLRLLGLVR